MYSELWQTASDFLRALIASEAHPGGRLAAIRTVSEVAPPEGALEQLAFPILAWQFEQATESFRSTSGAQQQITWTFALYDYVRFELGAPTSDPVKQVRGQLANLWNDRAGNGLGPVLRSNPTMDDLVIYSIPSQQRLLAGRAANEPAGASGVYRVTLTALAEFSGGIVS